MRDEYLKKKGVDQFVDKFTQILEEYSLVKSAEDAVKDSVQKRQRKKIRGVGLSQELTEI